MSGLDAGYAQLLARQPDSVDALRGLAAVAFLQKRPEAAIWQGRGVRRAPEAGAGHFDLGAIWASAGETAKAIQAYRTALCLAPDLLAAWCNLGGVWHDGGRPALAVNAFSRAVALDPGLAAVQFNLALAQRGQKRETAALAAFLRAISLQPDLAEAHSNLGIFHRDHGQFDLAGKAQKRALRLKPDFAQAHANLGTVWKGLGDLEAGLACYRTALAAKPDLAEAFYNIGNALRETGLLMPAIRAYHRSLHIKPYSADCRCNLGAALLDAGQPSQAIERYRAALDLRPDFFEARSNLIVALHYDEAVTAPSLLAEARHYAKTLPCREAVPPKPERHGKLRIGYVSGDFRQHPVGFFLLPVLRDHDKDRFDIFCYSNNGFSDDMTESLRACGPHWRVIHGMSDEDAARLIRSDGIDLLIDLSGHTALNRLPLFALKPAPVQASWLGYWGTTGLAAIDHIISDAITLPIAEEAFCSERPARLPATRFCYAPPGYAGPPALAGRTEKSEGVTFGSFNNLSKIGDPVIDLWARVLRAVPRSRLMLKWKSLRDPEIRARFEGAFHQRGIAPERLLLNAASPHADMLRDYRHVDIALDPFPFSGGITSCEALWMGVPVVTLPGVVASSRQTQGFLTAIGHQEWIAKDSDDYVAIAVTLAQNAKLRQSLRRSLRQDMTASPLCDGARFTRALERLFDEICSSGPNRV